MLVSTSSLPAGTIIYPESDGKRMADNTKQAHWIVVLYDNLRALFADRSDVFVAADNLWYPVENEPSITTAPDVYVVFGRPKGHRPSYKQWEEENVPITVVFEIRSPGNDHHELMAKQLFYEEHGVEEYYEYDPDANRLYVFVRRGEVLTRIRDLNHFVSPRMQIKFVLNESDFIILTPTGSPFLTFEQLTDLRNREKQRAEQADARAAEAQQRAAEAQQRAELVEQRYRRLIELNRKVRSGTATPAEIEELDELESSPS